MSWIAAGAYSDLVWPGDDYTSMAVTMRPRTDPTPDGFFWAHQFGFMGDGDGGYVGLQTLGTDVPGDKAVVFSIFGAIAADGLGSDVVDDDSDGFPGFSTRRSYPWVVDGSYRLTVFYDSLDVDGHWWKATIEDLDNETTLDIARIKVPLTWGNLTGLQGDVLYSTLFTERYSPPVADCNDIELAVCDFSNFVAEPGDVTPDSLFDHITSDPPGDSDLCTGATEISTSSGGGLFSTEHRVGIVTEPPPPEVPPTPVTIGSSVTWWRIQVLDWDMATLLAEPTVVTDIGFTDPPNDLGSGKLKLQNKDSAVAFFDDEHRVVRYSVLDIAASTEEAPVWKPLYAMIADRPKSTVIAPKEDIDEVTAITGRGILAQFAYSQVDPAGGAGVEPITSRRYWNFSHHSLDVMSEPWVDATYRSTQGDLTAVPPNGLAGLPWAFCNPLAFWLAPRVASGPDPDGIYLLAFDYELDADSQVIYEATADDAMQVWINERPMGDVWDSPDGDAASDSWRGSAHFPAGTLHVRIAVANFPRGPEISNNCGLFVMAVTRPTDTDPDGYNEEWLFTTADGFDFEDGAPGRWRALDYADTSPVPGPAVGWVLDDLWNEAIARGELAAWSRDWSSSTSTAGNAWGNLDGLVGYSCDVGSSYLQVLEDLRDAGWIEFDVTLDPDTGNPILHVWNPVEAGEARGDGLIRGNDAGTGNLTSLEFDIDHSGAVSGALVIYQNGQVRIGTGPKTSTISVDAITLDEAIAKATVIMNKADVLTAVSAGVVWIHQADGPYFGWGKFDTVPAVNRQGVIIDARVAGFGVSADSSTGRPVYDPQLIARRQVLEKRNALVLARAGLGGMSGRSAATIPVTVRQRPLEKLDLITLNWSIPGTVTELESGLVPPEKLMRLTRMLITSTSGSSDTYVALTQNGNLVGDGTIGAGTPVELFRSFLASVLRPTQRLQLATPGVLGSHQNLEIIGYGGMLGVPANPPAVIR